MVVSVPYPNAQVAYRWRRLHKVLVGSVGDVGVKLGSIRCVLRGGKGVRWHGWISHGASTSLQHEAQSEDTWQQSNRGANQQQGEHSAELAQERMQGAQK